MLVRRVQNQTVNWHPCRPQRGFCGKEEPYCVPATHDIQVPAKNLCQASRHYVHRWQHFDVVEVANGIIHQSQGSYTCQRGFVDAQDLVSVEVGLKETW